LLDIERKIDIPGEGASSSLAWTPEYSLCKSQVKKTTLMACKKIKLQIRNAFEFADLANKITRYPVKFEFHVNNK